MNHIRAERVLLNTKEDAVRQHIRALEGQLRTIGQAKHVLHRRCKHPNEQRERDYSMYSDTEYYCPDCGRERVC